MRQALIPINDNYDLFNARSVLRNSYHIPSVQSPPVPLSVYPM